MDGVAVRFQLLKATHTGSRRKSRSCFRPVEILIVNGFRDGLLIYKSPYDPQYSMSSVANPVIKGCCNVATTFKVLSSV